MEVQDIFDRVEDAPAELREFYVKQQDGKFKFDPAGAVAGLKKNKEDILREKLALEEKYRGVDTDEYKRLKKQIADELARQQREGGDWEAREKSIRDSFTPELTTRDTRISVLTKSLEKNLVDAALTTAIIAEKGRIKPLVPAIRPYVKMVEENGDYVAKVVDNSGKVRYSGGQEMTIAQLVAEFKADSDFQGNFEVAQAAGSGTGPGAGRRGGPTDSDLAKIVNPVERLKASRRVGK